MSMGLAIALYLASGLALAWLRFNQGARAADAVFGGLFWPADLSRRWIDWLVRALLETGWEKGWEKGRA